MRHSNLIKTNKSYIFFLSILAIIILLGVEGKGNTLVYFSDDILCRYKVPVSCGIKKTLLCISNKPDYSSIEILKGCGCDFKDLNASYGNEIYMDEECTINELKMSGYVILLLGMKIDINSATFIDLVSIDGIGDSIAERIINHRLQVQRFERIEDLLDIRGIGVKTLNKLSKYICIDCN